MSENELVKKKVSSDVLKSERRSQKVLLLLYFFLSNVNCFPNHIL